MIFLEVINSDICLRIVCNKTGGTIKGDIKNVISLTFFLAEAIGRLTRLSSFESRQEQITFSLYKTSRPSLVSAVFGRYRGVFPRE